MISSLSQVSCIRGDCVIVAGQIKGTKDYSYVSISHGDLTGVPVVSQLLLGPLHRRRKISFKPARTQRSNGMRSRFDKSAMRYRSGTFLLKVFTGFFAWDFGDAFHFPGFPNTFVPYCGDDIFFAAFSTGTTFPCSKIPRKNFSEFQP